MSVIEQLYLSISKRLRPEEVAELICHELDGLLSRDEAYTLDRGSWSTHASVVGL